MARSALTTSVTTGSSSTPETPLTCTRSPASRRAVAYSGISRFARNSTAALAVGAALSACRIHSASSAASRSMVSGKASVTPPTGAPGFGRKSGLLKLSPACSGPAIVLAAVSTRCGLRHDTERLNTESLEKSLPKLSKLAALAPRKP